MTKDDPIFCLIERQKAEIERLKAALRDIANMAEQYNYVGWQRIVGQMQKRAVEELKQGKDRQTPDSTA